VKIAYLILAHGNYKQLQRLLDALQYPGCKFYIHIDRKSPMPDIQRDDVYFIKDRVKVYHSTFSENKATIKLMQKAVEDDVYDRYILLSGMDYPVRSNEEIISRINNDEEYITIYKWPNHLHASSYFKYYYFDCFNRRQLNFKKRFFESIEKSLRKLRIQKKFPFQLYTGYQWFILSHKYILLILDTLKKDKRYIKFFSTCRITSESCFHSIIGNSSLMNNKIKPYFTFVDFGKEGYPAILTKDYLEELRSGDYLFARKFDEKSDEVINLINVGLRNEFAFTENNKNFLQ
jgi:hypothetical protein